MKLIIAGSRRIDKFGEINLLIQKLISLLKEDITEFVSGGAKGVDAIGERYAIMGGFTPTIFPADWDRYGNHAAGVIRNKQMANYADIAIVIWDGKSSGSFNMIKEMGKLNKPCFVEIYQ